MKTVVILGKRRQRGEPLDEWPDGTELVGGTNSQEKYEKKLGRIERWHAWADLHPVKPTKFYRGIEQLRPKTLDWYRTLPGPSEANYRPLWMLEKDPTIPASEAFPIHDVLAAFPVDRHFYSCQVDLLMPFFLLRGYQRIALLGHGISRDPVHMCRHRGILHWIAVARERGVEVIVVPPSWFIPPKKVYGFESGGGADTWQ